MKAYKLMRLKKDGKLYPLFINKKEPIVFGEWMKAQEIPTKGFAVRKGWHCTIIPFAPHLKTKLKSGEVRVWVEVDVSDVVFYNRPESQGGVWALAQHMRANRILSDETVEQILQKSGRK